MSKMIDEIIAAGIKLKSYSVGTHKTTCPKCSHTRKNKSDPCLYVNVESDELALWKCYNCNFTGKAGANQRHYEKREREYATPEVKKTTNLTEECYKWFEGRGFEREFVKRMEEKKLVWWDSDKKSIALPFYVDGQIVNIKYRGISKKFFSLSQGAKLVLYGYDVCCASKQYKEDKEIIIVEGEMDVLAFNSCGVFNVVSVPNGAPAPNAKNLQTHLRWLQEHEAFFDGVKNVILAVDNDDAGHRLEEELARRIGVERCERVRLPYKDANDTMQEIDRDGLLDCVRDVREPYPIKGLYRVNDFKKSVYGFYENGAESGVSTGWLNLDRYYTIKTKQFSVVTGIPNSGKSEWLDALLINLSEKEDWSHVVFSPENSTEEHIAKLAEKIARKSFTKDDKMSRDELDLALKKLNKHFYFELTDDSGEPPTLDWILDKAKKAIYRYGVKGIVIDPFNEIEHKYEQGQSETQYISKFLATLRRFARTHDVHIWIVAHPAKLAKDKDGVIQAPGLYDISGSAHWVNKADNGIVVHRSGDKKGGTEIYIRKVRSKWVGKQGKCNLIYNIDCGRYSTPASEQAEGHNFSLMEDIPYEPEEVDF